jgi:hypothetical protein
MIIRLTVSPSYGIGLVTNFVDWLCKRLLSSEPLRGCWIAIWLRISMLKCAERSLEFA